MVKLNEILDVKLLANMLGDGYVRAQTHPDCTYMIYNYTEKTAYEGVWNDVTRQCRGLIVDYVTSDVVARPFRKFFNYGQAGAPDLDLNARVTVTDKADGSLGILYRMPDGDWRIATRGSFTSEQAIHATELFKSKYAGHWNPLHNYTYLFEIIYPENRIVLDYHKMDDLILLGAVDIASGKSISRSMWTSWSGSIITQFEYYTLHDALAAQPRENAEGLVVHFFENDERVKIKQDDYVALHRILTGTTARTVWTYLAVNACKHLIKESKHWGSRLGIDPKRAEEILAVGDDWYTKLIAGVPDEFYAWTADMVSTLTHEVMHIGAELSTRMQTYRDDAMVTGVFDRRKFWESMKDETPEHRGIIVSMYDGNDITTNLWKLTYPGVERPFKKISEDVA